MPTTQQHGNGDTAGRPRLRSVTTRAYWAALEVEGVENAIKQAVNKVSFHYSIDKDDLLQDARLAVVTTADLLDCIDEDKPELTLGTLQYRLERDLVTIADREVLRRHRQPSYEERNDRNDGDEGFAPRPANIAIRNDTSTYTRELVESLIPAVWDESFCYGVRVENAPDPDMPRGTTNKATGNTLAAHIVDIKTGWTKTLLTLNERRALLLCYGLDWTTRGAGFNLGVNHSTVVRWLYAGVGKLVATLNGHSAEVIHLADVRRDLAVAA
ncbi:hypothetical protein NSZ01_05160 [Nocardioides szechwanensis]|uniref:Uncharacterized protein n=1 Tax=Nocardioides szechwanensis TaxID=1005944 RepID=A0A1G9W4N2_9ACTN|nr:hypothetical protein [Nocardioides szechwanensis]GEP32748.1 hypothetical protein NSZ01_05160 [Nocardioides szechwanensis]SDM79450.1 hypothetical protein SAMN05192576_0946 [Nocardioides szechwanensis]